MDIATLPKLTIENALLRFGITPEQTAQYRKSVTIIDETRERELSMRSWLPSQVVRRLDAGFARSNTVHPDTALALYAFCRALSPDFVYETGTYWGYATSYMAAALKDNQKGVVHTFDIYEHAGKHIDKSLLSWVDLHIGKPSTETLPGVLATAPPDIFFQDSLHDYDGVVSELAILKNYLKPTTLVLFHDFVAPDVRRAAVDVLINHDVFVLDGEDPQELGMAFPKPSVP